MDVQRSLNFIQGQRYLHVCMYFARISIHLFNNISSSPSKAMASFFFLVKFAKFRSCFVIFPSIDEDMFLFPLISHMYLNKNKNIFIFWYFNRHLMIGKLLFKLSFCKIPFIVLWILPLLYKWYYLFDMYHSGGIN